MGWGGIRRLCQISLTGLSKPPSLVEIFYKLVPLCNSLINSFSPIWCTGGFYVSSNPWDSFLNFSPRFPPSRRQWPRRRSRSRRWAVSIQGLLFVIVICFCYCLNFEPGIFELVCENKTYNRWCVPCCAKFIAFLTRWFGVSWVEYEWRMFWPSCWCWTFISKTALPSPLVQPGVLAFHGWLMIITMLRGNAVEPYALQSRPIMSNIEDEDDDVRPKGMVDYWSLIFVSWFWTYSAILKTRNTVYSDFLTGRLGQVSII